MMRNMQDSRQPSQRDMQGLLNLYNSGQMAAAETAAKQLLRSYPGALMLHSVLGSAQAAQRKFAEAAASFQQVVALNPKSAETHSNLGLVLQEQGRSAEAVASFRKAIALQPADHLQVTQHYIFTQGGVK